MKVTGKFIESNTNGGMPTKRQAELLGEGWPLLKGWRQRMEQRTISEEDADMFRRLKKQSKKKIEPLPENLVEPYREEKFKELPRGRPKSVKWVVVGGMVKDGVNWVYWPPETVAAKYGVDPDECLLVGEWSQMPIMIPDGSKLLQIRYDGNWSLPKLTFANIAAN